MRTSRGASPYPPGRVRLYKEDTWWCVSLTALSHAAPAGDTSGNLQTVTGGGSGCGGLRRGGSRYLVLLGQGEQGSEYLASHLVGKSRGGDAPINYAV